MKSFKSFWLFENKELGRGNRKIPIGTRQCRVPTFDQPGIQVDRADKGNKDFKGFKYFKLNKLALTSFLKDRIFLAGKM